MRLPIAFTASPFMCLLVVALSGCTGHLALDPAGFGSPPAEASVESQVQAAVANQWSSRTPSNLVVGQPKPAYHAKLGFTSEEVVWQGYAVPVTMDIDTASGRRVEGRKYAAMFSGDLLVGLVDYPGTTNAKGSMGFYWSDGRQPASPQALNPSAAVQKPEEAAKPVAVKSAPRPAPQNDLLIDPLSLNDDPVLEPQTPSKTAPKTAPSLSPKTASKTASKTAPTTSTVPVATPIPAPGQTAPAPVPAAPKAPQWGEPPATPAVGTKLYLASNKTYVGSVVEYADLHAFTNGAIKPAVRVRYLNGAENWFTVKVAQQVYVVQKED